MKKSTKIILHAITGVIVSAISFIGFKKGIQAINCKMEEEQENLPEDEVAEETEIMDEDE